MHHGGRRLAGVVVSALVIGLYGMSPATRAPDPRPELALVDAVVPCSSGLVALTFDDGPDPAVTPDLLDILESRGVPATFFVVGQRVDAAPRVVRGASARGFTIANHTYAHEPLTLLGDSAIRATLSRTRRSIVAAGARPSKLMRPPYGLIDHRVREVVHDAGLTPVLWTVDPRDWEGYSAATIADRVLAQLRPHRRNVVLQHDGIGNSPNSVQAVPRIVRGARQRGYCFAALGKRGRPLPPVPRVSVTGARVREGPDARLRHVVKLDRPTSRPTSVRVRTVGGTAKAGKDYRERDLRVRFPVGARSATVGVAVRNDRLDERREHLVLRLSAPRGLNVERGRAKGVILDDDPPPQLTVLDASVTEPTDGPVMARVVLKLSRPSARRVAATVRTEPGTATSDDYTHVSTQLWFPPGIVRLEVPVPVLADDVEEDAEHLTLRIIDATRADIAHAVATVWIVPPPLEEQ